VDSETSGVKMSVNKNFVVKNGIQVSTNLVFADNSIDSVGIGTTTPGAKLDVVGGIKGETLTLSDQFTGTGANLSGVVTSSTGFSVGAGGTVISVDVTNNSTGFNQSTPDTDYTLNVQPGAGQSAANFGGGVVVEGDLTVTGNTSGIQVGDLTNVTITGIITASDADVYTRFNVVNAGSGAYQYEATGIGFTENTDNPLLYLIRGKQYRFYLNASGHPFYIKNAAGAGSTNQYNAGVEGQGTQVGILTFTVPFNAPSSVYYQCGIHAGMGNTAYILDQTGSGGGTAGISSISVFSAGTLVGTTTSLDFTGLNQTVTVDGDKIDIEIRGETPGTGIGSPINYSDGQVSPFAYIDAVSEVTNDIELDNTNAGPGTSFVVVASPSLVINTGVAVTVGAGKTVIIDILNLSSFE